MKTERHTCPTCRWKHHNPKASNALWALTFAGTFTVIEVIAALQLDGWVSWALWAVAARNVWLIVTVIVGLAHAAANSPAFRASLDGEATS